MLTTLGSILFWGVVSPIIAIITTIVYGLLYGTVAVCQTNDKIFLQYRLQNFLTDKNVALTVSFVLFLSRFSRLLSNISFNKIYNKFKNKVLYIIYFVLLISVSLFILGKLVQSAIIGSIMMATGFVLLLTLNIVNLGL